MCKCLSESVVCCCCKCALSLLISLIFSSLVIIAIVGGTIYYFYYHNEKHDNPVQDLQKDLNKGYDNAVDGIKDIYKGIKGN